MQPSSLGTTGWFQASNISGVGNAAEHFGNYAESSTNHPRNQVDMCLSGRLFEWLAVSGTNDSWRTCRRYFMTRRKSWVLKCFSNFPLHSKKVFTKNRPKNKWLPGKNSIIGLQKYPWHTPPNTNNGYPKWWLGNGDSFKKTWPFLVSIRQISGV